MVLWVIVGLTVAFSPLVQAAPWEQGERLAYTVRWGFLTAGQAELEFAPTAGGTYTTYTVLARAWTNLPVFSLRERLRSTGVLANWQPSEFRQTQVENSYVADKQNLYQPPRYRNVQDQTEHPLTIDTTTLPMPAPVRDILSAFYHLRQTVTTYDTIPTLPITYLDRVGTLRFLAGEVRSVTFQGQKIFVRALTPVFNLQKYTFDTSQTEAADAHAWTFWVSEDAARIPYQIDYASPFGRFRATLVGINQPSIAPANIPAQGPLPGPELSP